MKVSLVPTRKLRLSSMCDLLKVTGWNQYRDQCLRQHRRFYLFVFPLNFDIGHFTEHCQWLLSLKQKSK